MLDDSCRRESYVSPNNVVEPFPHFDKAKANVFRYRQQQSVNLGSWFVHEQWMTPSVFACASGKKGSELDIASGWGSIDSARSVLEKHWDTFINETDFEYLASIGINTVRLPIGYWSLGPTFCAGTPFAHVADVYRNAWAQVVRAINMANNAGIGVLVDLHGAPGSQNGQPHSGISDGATDLFDVPANQDKTIAVLTFLIQQLSGVPNVVGIQMLNEPKNVPQLAGFYTRAIEALRQTSPEASSFPLYLHDGFDLNRFSNFIAARTDFVVQDYHSYFVFTPSDDSESAHDHTADIKGFIANSLTNASKNQRRNLVVDEWSCALTPKSIANEPDQEGSRTKFCTGQMGVYTNATAGWSFWSYKKEECIDDPGWCFKAAVGRNLPPSFFSYGQGPLTEPGQLQNVATIVAEMNLPSDVQALSRGRTSSPARTLAESPFDAQTSSAPALLSWTRRAYTSQDPSIVSALSSPDSSQRSGAKGYSDGYLTAKIFALHKYSRLGFVGQYIADSISAHGPDVIAPGTEDTYRDQFLKGLSDGEEMVRGIIV
ncbi:glycoside hydrolase [Artomyces pyxidatus]|uniref:Glycoside hydrolase n=1 Tax=Artomyces pyxidatus TaxID=48021 RepID=A0ACB8T2K1_9AGAM|nr:glycoside hydrolase [Artomyces pyxidatus]